jgi:pimeloyl-ACP methyl ester carboxylesterase
MLISGLVIALVVLALVTQAGVLLLERTYPPLGKFIDVAGARLHVVDTGPKDAPGLPVVLIHGASSSLETMRKPLGDLLAKNHRVILIDRPGLGWSTRERVEDSTPSIQARMIDEALGKLGIDRAIMVGHSLAGAILPELALNHPKRTAGLVMLAPVAYPWPGGVGQFNELASVPLLGPLLAYTITLPVGLFLVDSGTRYVFSPQPMPEDYVDQTAVRMVLRPRVFLNNASDLNGLKPEVARQAPDYPNIKMPVVVVTGDADSTVSPKIHSLPFADAVPGTKLIVLPNVGHMPHVAAPDLIVSEIEAMMAKLSPRSAAAAN